MLYLSPCPLKSAPYPDSGVGWGGRPDLPLLCPPSSSSPLQSQKGCRRPVWHTAGWVGAGSRRDPTGKEIWGLSWRFRETLAASSRKCTSVGGVSAMLLSHSLPAPESCTAHTQYQAHTDMGGRIRVAHGCHTWRCHSGPNVTRGGGQKKLWVRRPDFPSPLVAPKQVT